MWVLTVAHCFHPSDNASAYKVFAGIIEVPAVDKEEITKFYQERSVSDVVLHPRFSFEDLKGWQNINTANGIVNKETSNYLYDLALIRLQTPFSDDTKVIIRPLRMSPSITHLEQEHCVIVAWERFQKQDDNKQVKAQAEVRLQWKRVWLEPSKVCERRHNETLVNIMCVGSDVVNKTCYGPGGSPLVCRIANKDRMVKLLGISLWIKISVGCSDIFAQYLWVEGYENWMARVMRTSLSSHRRLSVHRRIYDNSGLHLCMDKALVLAALAACALSFISWTEILGTNRSHIPQASSSHHYCFLDVT